MSKLGQYALYAASVVNQKKGAIYMPRIECFQNPNVKYTLATQAVERVIPSKDAIKFVNICHKAR